MAGIALRRGDYEWAAALLEEGLPLLRGSGNTFGIAFSLANLGRVALEQEKVEQAQRHFAESLGLFRSLDDKRGIAECLEGLAGVAIAQADAWEAARLLGAATALRDTIGAPLLAAVLPAYQRTLAGARAGLDQADFAEAWNSYRGGVEGRPP